MMQLRKAMLAYPDGGRVVAGAHLPNAPTLAKSIEYSISSLVSQNIDLNTALHVAITANRYTFGYVIEEQASPTMEEIRNLPEGYISGFLEQYPNLAAATDQLRKSVSNGDRSFIIGLHYIIRGSSLL
jgi:TetR/AcrR family tetracycline transcriptional repressor